MNPIVLALRRPYTVLAPVLAVLCGRGLAVWRMKVDLFPALNQPLITICQPYGGMTPQQMEGPLTNYYEFHSLYVNGIDHVESKTAARSRCGSAPRPAPASSGPRPSPSTPSR